MSVFPKQSFDNVYGSKMAQEQPAHRFEQIFRKFPNGGGEVGTSNPKVFIADFYLKNELFGHDF